MRISFTYLNELMDALPVHPASVPIAHWAGRIDSENAGRGIRLPLADLLIGVTAKIVDVRAEGRRVAKGTIAASAVSASSPLKSSVCNPSVAANNFTVTESYVLGQSGEQLTALAPGAWTRTNVYGAGQPLATYDNDAQGTVALHFLLTDHLGTRRLQTDPAGTPETDCQSLPYGDSLYCVPAPNAPATADDANPLHYTGKERDAETGNDYFGARYYASNVGRFMSPDWSAQAEPVPYGKLGAPPALSSKDCMQPAQAFGN